MRQGLSVLLIMWGFEVSKYGTVSILGERGKVNIVFEYRLEYRLDSLADVNEVIDMLVKAKNLAFPSGGEEHRRKMEALREVVASGNTK